MKKWKHMLPSEWPSTMYVHRRLAFCQVKKQFDEQRFAVIDPSSPNAIQPGVIIHIRILHSGETNFIGRWTWGAVDIGTVCLSWNVHTRSLPTHIFSCLDCHNPGRVNFLRQRTDELQTCARVGPFVSCPERCSLSQFESCRNDMSVENRTVHRGSMQQKIADLYTSSTSSCSP